MKKILLFISFVVHYSIGSIALAQDVAVENYFKSKFSYVQYYPNNGGWYLLKYTKNGQTYYGMGDIKGNVIVSEALSYKLYDGFVEFNLIDMQKKAAHDMWQQSMKDYQIAYQKYKQIKAEYEGHLNAYNKQVEYAKTVARERYKKQVAHAQRQAQYESQKNAANYNNAGILGSILGGIASGVSQAVAASSVNYDAIEKEVLAENNLLTPPIEPYNPIPNKPTEPENGYYWKAFSFQQPCPYTEIDYKAISTKDGFADVKKDGKNGLVNARMEVIIPCTSSTRVKKEVFPNKNILICVNAKYGVLSPIGKKLLPCEYSDIKLSEGYLLCKKDNRWGVFTAQAKELYPCQYQNVRLDRICGKLCLFTQQKGLWGLTDFRSGKELLPTNFSKMEAFGPNGEYIKTIKDEKIGLYTNNGVLIFPCEYSDIEYGKLEALNIFAFQLKKDNTIGLYDGDGVAIMPINKYSSYFVNSPFLQICQKGLYGIYATYGKEIVPCKYKRDIRFFAQHHAFVVSNTQGTTLVDFNGQELFQPIPNIQIVDLFEDHILVQSGTKYGAMNYAGEIIVPIKIKREQVNNKVEVYAKNKKHDLEQENLPTITQTNAAGSTFYTQYPQMLANKMKFSFFAQNYVERIINDWQKKGEFEKIDDWKKRVNVETRKQMVYALTKDAQKAYLDRFQEALVQDDLEIVGNYDPDNETYRIKTKYSKEDILVPVPADDAQEFKTMFASLKKEPTFYVENDEVGLAEYKFYLSADRVYKYSNEASLKYNIAQVNYDFDEISIDTNLSSTKKGKQTFSTSSISIGKSDVDISIPLTSKKQENTFVVIIANTNYDEAPMVQYAYNDGIIFKDYCIKTLGIPEENIQFKADATYSNIKQSVNWLREVANNEVLTEKKKIIFYYSGHGIPDELTKSTYLLPKDGVAVDIANTGYKVSDLYAMLAEISSESVVFLDACFSGLTKSGGALASTKGVAIKVNDRIPQGNSVIFSASSSNEVAHQYEEKAHGLFTYYLLKGLQDSKGEISYGQLFDYIRKEVARTSLTNTKIKKSQTPTIVAGAKASNWKERTFL